MNAATATDPIRAQMAFVEFFKASFDRPKVSFFEAGSLIGRFFRAKRQERETRVNFKSGKLFNGEVRFKVKTYQAANFEPRSLRREAKGS